MDNVSLNEMMAITKEISSRDVVIAEQKNTIAAKDRQIAEDGRVIEDLRRQLTEKDKQLEEKDEKLGKLEGSLEQMKKLLQQSETVKFFYRTYIVLQKEKLKVFFSNMYHVAYNSVCFSMLVNSVPDDAPQYMLANIKELSKSPNALPQINNHFEKDSHCLVANSDIHDSKIGI